MLPRSPSAVTPKSATTRSFLTAHDAEAPSDPRPRALTRFAQTCALVPHRGRSIRPAPSVSSSEPVRLDVQTSSSLHQKTLKASPLVSRVKLHLLLPLTSPGGSSWRSI
uniref:(northern house mosquito) hypothetical protein n=1 Tax=Culex pipiens TaxID=7175 RepID=A0A8D8BS61_CULPI